MQAYYTAHAGDVGYRAVVYTYDWTSNHRIVLWKLTDTYDTMEDALDAAAVWCADNGIDAELA